MNNMPVTSAINLNLLKWIIVCCFNNGIYLIENGSFLKLKYVQGFPFFKHNNVNIKQINKIIVWTIERK